MALRLYFPPPVKPPLWKLAISSSYLKLSGSNSTCCSNGCSRPIWITSPTPSSHRYFPDFGNSLPVHHFSVLLNCNQLPTPSVLLPCIKMPKPTSPRLYLQSKNLCWGRLSLPRANIISRANKKVVKHQGGKSMHSKCDEPHEPQCSAT